jgi:putative transposase
LQRNSKKIEFKGSQFERDVILLCVRWYVAYPISYRQLEEMMEERGVDADHSTLNRWVIKCAPLPDRQFRARKRPIGSSWRMDETYVKVKGRWKNLYRAADKTGGTVEFLLTATRDHETALRFLRKAIVQQPFPRRLRSTRAAPTRLRSKVTTRNMGRISKSVRSNIYNIVEQGHRTVKRVAQPMLGFKSLRSAATTIAGMELILMIRKG